LGVAKPYAPGHAASEALAGLLRDRHTLVARLLAELLDASGARCRDAVGRHFLAELQVGQGADHPDLLAIDADLRRSFEPPLRDPAREPPSDLISSGHDLHLNYQISSTQNY